MLKRFFRSTSFLAILILAGCYVSPPALTELSVTLSGNSYLPASWRVPAAAPIALRLENKDSVRHDWIILYRQATSPFDSADEASVFWRHSIDPGVSETVQFTAPAAAGNYPVVDATYLDDGMAGQLTVVQTQDGPK